MKKHFLLLTVFLLSVPVLAQRGDFGIKAGVNLSTLYFADMEGINTKTDVVAGIFAEAGRKAVRFQVEALYSREGFILKEDESSDELSMRLNYINFPFLIKMYPVEWFSVDLGYQTGVLLNARAHSTGGYRGGAEKDEDIPEMRSVNNSLILGVTFHLGAKVDFSARYNVGISDLINKQEGDMVRSRIGQFTLGYRF